ncbi:MAG: FGGY-family carbohydrate kinase [Pseudomonadota bacterium]
MGLFLGIDIGTSGVRAAVIDEAGGSVATARVALAAPNIVDGRPEQDATSWWSAVVDCLNAQAAALVARGRSMRDVEAVAVDGTSGTLVLVDADLRPVTAGLMYNAGGFDAEGAAIDRAASASSIARGGGSTLARLLVLQKRDGERRAVHALHQADWVAARLSGRGGRADETNVLKLGYDLLGRQWPSWLEAAGVRTELLPDVVPVGTVLGELDPAVANRFGLPASCLVRAGTTDSNAAFLAAGATEIGDAVTSLGTTLAIKLLSDRPVSDPSRGVYSHRIKSMWLAGGASNTGGGALLAHFSREQLGRLATQLDPDHPTGLDYYPLARPGERFPVNDPALDPRLTPRPPDDATFYQAMLEGIAAIERQGYAVLAELGCPPVRRVFTAGGGAGVAGWTVIRERAMGVPLVEALSDDAAVGAARIAADLIG